MTIRHQILTFLKLLELAIPPAEACHHAMTFAKYGSEAEGWTDKLALQLNLRGKWVCLFLEDGDLEKPSDVLISEVVALTEQPVDGVIRELAKRDPREAFLEEPVCRVCRHEASCCDCDGFSTRGLVRVRRVDR
jgi:hypothetical protein